MANVRFKYNKAGFDALRNSAGAQSLCLSYAQDIAARANSQTKGTFIADVRAGTSRCHAMVKPDDGPSGNIAARDNMKKNILARARGW